MQRKPSRGLMALVVMECVASLLLLFFLGFLSFLGYLFLMMILGSVLVAFGMRLVQRPMPPQARSLRQGLRPLSLVVAGTLFFIPGVLSDVLGLMCLLSPSLLLLLLGLWGGKAAFFGRFGFGEASGRQEEEGIIDIEYHEVSDEDLPKKEKRP